MVTSQRLFFALTLYSKPEFPKVFRGSWNALSSAPESWGVWRVIPRLLEIQKVRDRDSEKSCHISPVMPLHTLRKQVVRQTF